MLNWLKQLSIKNQKDLIKQSCLKSPGGVVDIFSIRDCNLRTHMPYAQSTYIIHAFKHAVLVLVQCSADENGGTRARRRLSCSRLRRWGLGEVIETNNNVVCHCHEYDEQMLK